MLTRKLLALMIPALFTAGCANHAVRDAAVNADITATMNKASQANLPPPQAITESLLPPLKVELPKNIGKQMEGRFDLTINNAPAQQVFMGIVSGTPYSMLIHPNVTGTISVRLKDVTLMEALQSIRELYGYEFRVQGNRIMVEPNSLQTRVFQVNYFAGSREGTSAIRFSGTTLGAQATGTAQINTGTIRSGTSGATSGRDFWNELQESITTIIGSAADRSVVVNPRSGTVVVRALPSELREVAKYLNTSQLAAERQVIIEAKVVDVTLDEANQSGVNWSQFRPSSGHFHSVTDNIPGVNLATGSPLKLSYQAANFVALISFLQSQGKVTVLSSPRISTLNNQKAILKIGTDEYFVTKIEAGTTTTSSNNTTTTNPTVTTTPMFSGVALDVTPQIDENDNIILHVHPSISQVTTINKEASVGGGSSVTLPLPSNAISETDSIVRAKDGQVIVIGGLMRTSLSNADARVPGAGEIPGVGAFFGNKSQTLTKRELVILLKPTIVQGDSTWNQDIRDTSDRLDNLTVVRPKARDTLLTTE